MKLLVERLRHIIYVKVGMFNYGFIRVSNDMLICVCVRACVRACVHAGGRAREGGSAHACMRACVCVSSTLQLV